jgi:hypothetical protein
MNMKTNKALIAVFASVTLFSAAVVNAQYKAMGADGITASPKLRETIDRLAPSTPAPNTQSVMACPTCRDEYTTRVDTTAKGSIKPTVVIAKHLCDGCKTTIKTVGVGKASGSVVEHKCAAGTASDANCCAPKNRS